MKRALLFSLLIGFVLVGCTKEKEGAVPQCIQERLKTFDSDEACQNASVMRYNFEGKSVYVFDREFCAQIDSSEVRDENCGLLGYLGGVLNNDTINNQNFNLSAEYESIIWAN